MKRFFVLAVIALAILGAFYHSAKNFSIENPNQASQLDELQADEESRAAAIEAAK